MRQFPKITNFYDREFKQPLITKLPRDKTNVLRSKNIFIMA